MRFPWLIAGFGFVLVLFSVFIRAGIGEPPVHTAASVRPVKPETALAGGLALADLAGSPTPHR